MLKKLPSGTLIVDERGIGMMFAELLKTAGVNFTQTGLYPHQLPLPKGHCRNVSVHDRKAIHKRSGIHPTIEIPMIKSGKFPKFKRDLWFTRAIVGVDSKKISTYKKYWK
jgi:hypothetical protein